MAWVDGEVFVLLVREIFFGVAKLLMQEQGEGNWRLIPHRGGGGGRIGARAAGSCSGGHRSPPVPLDMAASVLMPFSGCIPLALLQAT